MQNPVQKHVSLEGATTSRQVLDKQSAIAQGHQKMTHLLSDDSLLSMSIYHCGSLNDITKYPDQANLSSHLLSPDVWSIKLPKCHVLPYVCGNIEGCVLQRGGAQLACVNRVGRRSVQGPAKAVQCFQSADEMPQAGRS